MKKINDIVIKMFQALCKNEPIDFLKDFEQWDELVKVIDSQKLLWYLFPCIKDYMPRSLKFKYMAYIILARNNAKRNLYEIVKIQNLAIKKSIQIPIIKGYGVSHFLFNDFLYRQSCDIDLLIDESHISIADKILRSENYKQIWEDYHYSKRIIEIPKPLLKAKEHHEYCLYYKEDELNKINIEISRHIHNTITGRNVRRFLQHSICVKEGNIQILTLDKIYTILTLFENAYSNSHMYMINRQMFLRDYYDIYIALTQLLSEDEYPKLIEEALQNNMISAMISVMYDLYGILYDERLQRILHIFLNFVPKYNDTIHKDLPLTKRIFNESIIASTYFCESLSAKLFSPCNAGYSKPIAFGLMGCPFKLVTNTGIAFHMRISLISSWLKIKIRCKRLSKLQYRPRIYLFSNEMPFYIVEIMLQYSTSQKLSCFIFSRFANKDFLTDEKFSYCKNYKDELYSETINNETIDVSIPYSILYGGIPKIPKKMAVSVIIDYKVFNGVYQECAQMGNEKHCIILLNK